MYNLLFTRKMNTDCTLPSDMLTEILNAANSEVLDIYSQTCNKNNMDQLKNINNKLINQNVIPIQLDDFRNFNTFDALDCYEDQYETKNTYSILYHIMLDANKEAKKIVFINRALTKHDHHPTDGIITMDDAGNIKNNYTLPTKIDKNYNINQIFFDGDEYQLELTNNDECCEADDFIYVDCTEKEIIDIITLILFDTYVGLNDNLFTTNKNVIFSHDQGIKNLSTDQMIMYTMYKALSILNI